MHSQKKGARSRTGSIMGQNRYFGVYLSACVSKQRQFGADGKGSLG